METITYRLVQYVSAGFCGARAVSRQLAVSSSASPEMNAELRTLRTAAQRR